MILVLIIARHYVYGNGSSAGAAAYNASNRNNYFLKVVAYWQMYLLLD
jgi:hypothetical protein